MIVEVTKDIQAEVDHMTIIEYYPLNILRITARHLKDMLPDKEAEVYRYEKMTCDITIIGIKGKALEEWK